MNTPAIKTSTGDPAAIESWERRRYCDVTRLLYIAHGRVPPSPNAAYDRFAFLSKVAEGEILLPIWWGLREEVPAYLQPEFPVYKAGNFSYHLFLIGRFPEAIQRFAEFYFHVSEGLRLHRQKKFDVIMAYGTNTTGVAGVLLKWLTGAKLIVEISGVPENAFRYDDLGRPSQGGIKRFFADRLLSFVGSASNCIKLLYPSQLRSYPSLKKKKVAVFHDFVPIRVVQPAKSEERYILSVGHPWYTKGMDVLIQAFKLIAPQFPDWKLKLMGHFPDRTYLDDLARGCPQIEFIVAAPNEIALKVIGACSVYALASRTEAMGRVLLEAMAARKPIIASAVGGVPHYIVDDDNGLLFESENTQELATKMATLLGSPELCTRLADRAYQKVMAEYDEEAYVGSFQRMLQSLQ
jgi:glycosyltransferase involved in cell wall biosynthesis